jgi:hypothetical protein
MLLSKKFVFTAIAVTALSLLAATTYASRSLLMAAPPLAIEIALAKPFYLPAATGDRRMSAVVRAPIADEDSGQEITAIKLSPVMDGDKVKVTVYALIGDVSDIKTIKNCKDWDALETIIIGTYTAGLDEEISITKLRDFGIRFETGDLKFRVVPKRQIRMPLDGPGDTCGCASCGTLECCPNPAHCIGCAECGQACCRVGP